MPTDLNGRIKMALHSEEIIESKSSMVKELDQASLPMILQNLQVYQYQFPVKSTIRELVSNGVDAIAERDAAIAILTGKAKEEDYFIHRDDDMYKDSNFDPSYFNLSYLHNNPTVTIVYEDGGAIGKDYLRVKDNGTGIGGKRLEGYLKLGYSTKRNSKLPLGKFGIGAKAGLSTGVPYFALISRYNGMEFKFNIYSQRVESIQPSEYPVNGSRPNKQAEFYTFANGYKAYWHPTKAVNGTEIVIESKKSKKQEYIEAVKSQLLYFKNVKMYVKKNGLQEEIPIQPKILYEDDFLVLSDNKQYSKPHLVINGVNYGYINWDELELEDKAGNIGIKVSAEMVSINPSRESVVWNEQTREAILSRVREASQIASELVSKELQTTDIIRWLKTYLSIRYRSSSDTGMDIVGRLSNLVDFHNIKPTFSLDSDLKIINRAVLMPGVKIQFVHKTESTKGGTTKIQLRREEIESVAWMEPTKPMYIVEGNASEVVLQYLASINKNGVYLFQYWPTDQKSWFEDSAHFKDDDRPWTRELLDDRHTRVVKLLEQSTELIQLSTVKVPETFEWQGILVASIDETKMTPEERRKLESRVVVHSPRGAYILPYGNQPQPTQLYTYQKLQPTMRQMLSLTSPNVYYGSTEDNALIQFATAIMRNWNGGSSSNDKELYKETEEVNDLIRDFALEEAGRSAKQALKFLNNWGPKAEYVLFRIAEHETKKYASKYKHISRFFLDKVGSTLTMSKYLIQWHTARIVKEGLLGFAFLTNYKRINPVIQAKFATLVAYVNDHYSPVDQLISYNYLGLSKDTYAEFLELHKRLLQFQLEIRTDPKTDIEGLAFSLNIPTGVLYADVIELPFYDMLQEVIEYGKPLVPLLNQVYILKELATLPDETEQAIKQYVSFMGLE